MMILQSLRPDVPPTMRLAGSLQIIRTITIICIGRGTFDAGTEASTYTFTIQSGNFHLNVRFESVEDVAKAESDKVASGSVALASGSLTTGSAELTVKDVTVSQDKKKEFEDAATITITAKNKTTYNKVVKLIKKSGAKNVKYKYKKKK